VELADMEDHDLWYLISGQSECHDPRFVPLVAMLRKS
jgi:succinate dehydrogenase flavin-adding protein (antitoxin of CptAB toxin-antitoxin module)